VKTSGGLLFFFRNSVPSRSACHLGLVVSALSGLDLFSSKGSFIYHVIKFLGFLDHPPPLSQCVELKLRWRCCVHTSTCPEIYF
jgi:hypothetical protein